jgi:hypothetical protein
VAAARSAVAALARDGLAALAGAGLALLLPFLAAQRARPAVLSFGPNDADYVQGFRPDWERDGETRFRWTGTAARVALPLHASGEGMQLRLRSRRHFEEPATVTLRVEGRAVHRFEVRAHADQPYRVETVRLPPLEGRLPFTVDIEARSTNPRPLGIAMDWLELERGSGRLQLGSGARGRAVLWVVLSFVALRLAGAGALAALGGASLVAVSLALGLLAAPLAAERTLRHGAVAWVGAGLTFGGALRVSRVRSALGVQTRLEGAALCALALAALGVRLALLLHPLFFYPDIRVHAMFAHDLARSGLEWFLTNFTANQFRYSLGLQFEHGHWYAFPYPPTFYLLTWPLTSIGVRSEIAPVLVACVANAAQTLLVFALARRLRVPGCGPLLAAATVPLLPLYVSRLSLALFPSLVGNTLETLVLLFLLAALPRLDRAGWVVALGSLLAAALLAYTQSWISIGLLLPMFLLWQVARKRSRGDRRRQHGLLLAGALGVAGALGLFYARQVPVMLQIQRGVPMPEEQILLEKQEARARLGMSDEEAPNDPHAGPTFDLWRGLRKAGWRLWLFYGPFSGVVAVGWLWMLRRLSADPYRLVVTWSATYLLITLGSGGLPGPNLLTHAKDVEVVAALCCAALGEALATLSRHSRSGAVLALALGVVGLAAATAYAGDTLAARFDLAEYRLDP